MEVRGPVPEAVRFSLQNLTCAYSGKVVVRGVSLDIPASGVTAFIGPSGAANPRSCAASTA
jgi:ABC-type phosphate transport system ATPase subunit